MKSNETLKSLVKELYLYAKEQLGFKKHAKIKLEYNKKNAADPLGTTGYYDPEDFTITVFAKDRHPKDVLRSCSHEISHHNQNCRGEFSKGITTQEGYAQKDKHLRKMEREAYEQGNMIFRDWTDTRKEKTLKENKVMSVKDFWNKKSEKVGKLLLERIVREGCGEKQYKREEEELEEKLEVEEVELPAKVAELKTSRLSEEQLAKIKEAVVRFVRENKKVTKQQLEELVKKHV